MIINKIGRYFILSSIFYWDILIDFFDLVW